MQRPHHLRGLCAPATFVAGTLLAGPTLAGDLVLELGPGQTVQDALNITGGSVAETIAGTEIHRIALPSGADIETAITDIETLLGPHWVEEDRRTAPPEIYEQDTLGFPDYEGLTSFRGPEDVGIVDHDDFNNQDIVSEIEANELSSLSLTGVTVAVIASGIDASHPLFNGFVVAGGYDHRLNQAGAVEVADGLDNDGDGRVDEAYGHGTFLAGVILRVNPDAEILPLSVLDSDGWGDAFDLAQAVYDAADSGVRVIALGVGMFEDSSAVNAAIDFAESRGAVVFAPAGNTGTELNLWPAARVEFDSAGLPIRTSGVSAIGTVGASGDPETFSSRGAAVDLYAPGVGVVGPYPGGDYAVWNGTGISTAVAAGAASLLLSIAPDYQESPATPMVLTADDVADEWGAGRLSTWGALIEVVIGS